MASRRRPSKYLLAGCGLLLVWLCLVPTQQRDKLGSFFAPAGQQSYLVYSPDGLVRGWDALLDLHNDGTHPRDKRLGLVHPIEHLMKRARERWDNLLKGQSKTLRQAMKEYTRRYKRPPPKGFSAWWQYCQDNNVKIVDDYDQIDRDIAPYFALSPSTFRSRVEKLNLTTFTSVHYLSPYEPSEIFGERAHVKRQRLLFELCEPFAQYLPDEALFYLSDHDDGTWLFGEDQKEAAFAAIAEHRFLGDDELAAFENRKTRKNGLVSACSHDSIAWRMATGEVETAPRSSTETKFVYDPRPGFDFCDFPELLQYHGAWSFDYTRETELRPIFQMSKLARNPEFLTPPLQAYENTTSAEAKAKTQLWEDKTIDKLFWRGSSTGDSFTKNKKNSDWRRSHRPRLHLLAQRTEGDENVWVARDGGWELETWSVKKLNERYMDVGIIGPIHQCNRADGTCEEMENELVLKDRVNPEQAAAFKYVVDVDGNGWSSRFHRLMMSGSLVFKTTVHVEWNTDWLTPWLHYIPVQHDYSDLYNILAFFGGSPDGRHAGRSDLGKEIADEARKFGEEYWRWEDMQAYMFRLILEYIRLGKDDRDAWIDEP